MLKKLTSVSFKQSSQFNKNFGVCVQQRLFATEAQDTKSTNVTFSEEVKNVLKPSVLKMLEKKANYDFVKKVNFLGTAGSIRLNTASAIQISSLNENNIFKEVTENLMDPWEYYWLKVSNNGNDPSRWLKSLEELRDIPVLMERCFKTMCRNGAVPTPAHMYWVLKAHADMGDSLNVGNYYDFLIRDLEDVPGMKLTEDCGRQLYHVAAVAGHGLIGEYIQKDLKDAGFEMESSDISNVEKFAEMGRKDKDHVREWGAEKTQTEPEIIQYVKSHREKALKIYARQYLDNIQPPLEKLLSPEQLNREEEEKFAKEFGIEIDAPTN